MGEQHLFTTLLPSDRNVEQAILAIKKGAHLLKCGRRGKPKFCPFRLSVDEKHLFWCSGLKERQLKLSSVTKIVLGQATVNFQRQFQQDREHRSFSLVYADGGRSLDLVCKDKAQADCWLVGLRAVVSTCHRSGALGFLRSRRGIQSCINSPAGYFRRKHNLGLVDNPIEIPQVRSLCGSPSLSLSQRCFSDGLSYYTDVIFPSDSSLSQKQSVANILTPDSPYTELDNSKKRLSYNFATDSPKNESSRFLSTSYRSPLLQKKEILKDVMVWGEAVVVGSIGGALGGATGRPSTNDAMLSDALLPNLLESAVMLDVQDISFGGKHAALVTKQGEVYCWGEGKGGRLGNKISMDVSYPKLVESLNGVVVQSISCGEFQTCAVTKSGELYVWGDNNHGAVNWVPYKISNHLGSVSILKVACGDWHTAMVSTSGQLFTYGDGTFGVLGHGNVKNVSQPKEVESLRGLRVKSVACGTWHTAGVVEMTVDHCKSNSIGGKLLTWGDRDKGKLGHADGKRRLVPTCVAQLLDLDFVQVSCGRTLTIGLTTLGKVYTMGSAVHGQLGNPNAKDKSITIVEGKLKNEFVKEISSGLYHIAVLTSRGSVYSWGKNANGQLGVGDVEDRSLPTFVDALRDRQVESIVCGSNLTAAICLHKSISVIDQSSCSGCKLAFGFMRKKRNCNNCGLLFCSSCTRKKITNTSLTQNKGKPSRVCDTCFNYLLEISHSQRLLKTENHSPVNRIVWTDEKEERGEIPPSRSPFFPIKESRNADYKFGERKILKSSEENQQFLKSGSSLPSGLPRWRQVTCPIPLETHFHNNSMALAHLNRYQFSSYSPLPQKDTAERISCGPIIAMEAENSSKSNKLIEEEVQRLKAEVLRLEKRCHAGIQKIQECERRIEENCSVAREEAVKGKALKDIIKALALRLHTMSEKGSSVLHETNNNPTCKDSPKPPKVELMKDREVDSECKSPIVFSTKMKSSEECEKISRMDSVEAAREEPQQDGTKHELSKPDEWMEQYEPGVYITFTTLPGGQNGLKRVRFSIKRFTVEEAESWWEENHVVVCEKYGIEEYTNSNSYQNQTGS